MNKPFSSQLYILRTNAQLTNHELGRLADVPESLISGLQNNNRRVGEYQARKLGAALKLTGAELEQFVLDAINTSTEKVLNEAKAYPAQLLNLLAVQLNRAGIPPENISGLTVAGDAFNHKISVTLTNGKHATLKTQLVCG